MKPKNFVKLFYLVAIFTMGCCFTNVFAEQYTVDDGVVVADYNFIEKPELGGTVLRVDKIHKPSLMNGTSGFGDHIRKKCAEQGINLRVVLGPEIFLRLSDSPEGTPDLTISPNQKCSKTTIVVYDWMLRALNLIYEDTVKTDSCRVSDPFSQLEVKSRKDGTVTAEVKRYTGVREYYTYYHWGRRIGKIKVTDPRIQPRMVLGSGIKYDDPMEAWGGFFLYQNPFPCEEFLLYDKCFKPTYDHKFVAA